MAQVYAHSHSCSLRLLQPSCAHWCALWAHRAPPCPWGLSGSPVPGGPGFLDILTQSSRPSFPVVVTYMCLYDFMDSLLPLEVQVASAFLLVVVPSPAYHASVLAHGCLGKG